MLPRTERLTQEHVEEVETRPGTRAEELKNRMRLLDEARSQILRDYGAQKLTAQEKKSILKWAKAGGSNEQWPLPPDLTPENLAEKVAEYGLAPYLDVSLFQPGDEMYKLVTRQYLRDADELRGLTMPRVAEPASPTPVPPSAPEVPHKSEPALPSVSPAPEPATPVAPPATPKIKPTKRSPELWPTEEKLQEIYKSKKWMASWKVWKMIMALLDSMQKHPDQYKALKDLSPEELSKKLSDAKEAPKLVQEFMHVATRGEMSYDDQKNMWDVLDKTKLTNMDVRVGLLVLEKAGFKVSVGSKNLELVPPGTEAAAKPFVLQFDTMDGVKRKQLGKGASYMEIETSESSSTDLKKGEYRITVDHHTDDPNDRKTSGAQLLYDYFSAAGLLTPEKLPEKDKETLERLLVFVNDHDNGRFPANKEFYQRSARTLWGVGSDSSVPAEVVFKIMQRGRKPEDPLTDEDLAEVISGTKKVEKDGVVTKEPFTIRDLIEGYPATKESPGFMGKEESDRLDAESFDRWKKLGYVVDTDYGPLFVALNVSGRHMPKQITARAWGGVPNVLLWSPDKHSFFISLGGGKTFNPATVFPQEGAEIIRGMMAIFKRQIKSPAELTATLTEILGALSKKKARHLTGDLHDYVEKTITPNTTLETLYSIYTSAPEKQQAVVDTLAEKWPLHVQSIIHDAARQSKTATEKNIYQEIENRVKNAMLARQRRNAPPPPALPPLPLPPAVIEPTAPHAVATPGEPELTEEEMAALLSPRHREDKPKDDSGKAARRRGAKPKKRDKRDSEEDE